MQKYYMSNLQPGYRYVNYAGQKIGLLTAIQRVPKPIGLKSNRAFWLCKCECGGERICSSEMLGKSLKNGNMSSCGCISHAHAVRLGHQAANCLVGKRFGRLLVLKRALKPENCRSRAAFWECKCDCGEIKIIRGSNLTARGTKSCGCLNKEATRKPPVVGAAIRKYYDMYLYSAEKRGFKFNIDIDEFKTLTSGVCHYCGVKPQKTITYRKDKCLVNGIDRIDNEIGYEKHNIVSCCEICNKAKRTMSIDQFREWVVKIYKNWIEG